MPREVYTRIAADLAAATVEHPSPRVQAAIEELVRDAIGQLNDLAARGEVPAPPELLGDRLWWQTIPGGGPALEAQIAAIRPFSPALAELLVDLSRVRFAPAPPAETIAEPAEPPSEAPSAADEPERATSELAETIATPTEPSAASVTGSATTTPAHAHPEPRERGPGSNLYGMVQCARCGHSATDIVPSRMRALALPWLLLRKRPYRCRSCNLRFFDWI
jgi:hypothetical protein